jgi:hypothetical protein
MLLMTVHFLLTYHGPMGVSLEIRSGFAVEGRGAMRAPMLFRRREKYRPKGSELPMKWYQGAQPDQAEASSARPSPKFM